MEERKDRTERNTKIAMIFFVVLLLILLYLIVTYQFNDQTNKVLEMCNYSQNHPIELLKMSEVNLLSNVKVEECLLCPLTITNCSKEVPKGYYQTLYIKQEL